MLLCSFPFVNAQPKSDAEKEKMWKEMQEFKMKFLAQEIDLKEDQKKEFFELYDEMSSKRAQCYKNARDLERKLKKNKDASEQEYQDATEAMKKAAAESAEIEKVYDEKFSTFLTPKQIYKLKEAEQEFRKKMEEMKHKKDKGHNKELKLSKQLKKKNH